MPTYEYECMACGLRLSHRQAMTDEPMEQCPRCGGGLRRLITGGTGFVMKEGGRETRGRDRESCRFEHEGKTCCGRTERCGEPRCRR